jgi:phage FluMu protein Com
MPVKRRVSEPVKKIVAARQNWRCADCDKLLSAAYQVDHRVALADGGTNAPSNLAALCPNCHALKTQLEAIARADKLFAEGQEQTRRAKVDAREDVVVPGTDMVRCTLCHQKRPRTDTSWADHVCPKLQTAALPKHSAKDPTLHMLARKSLHPTPLRPDMATKKKTQLSLKQFIFSAKAQRRKST